MRPIRILLTLSVGAFTMVGGCAAFGRSGPKMHDYEASVWPSRASDWTRSDWANLSINAMVERYGPPKWVEPDRVVWENAGVWRRITVWDRVEEQRKQTAPDNIEQAFTYPVPADMRRTVESFGPLIEVSEDASSLSVRSADEKFNFLAVNLADEIIRGVKTPEEAKAAYIRTVRLTHAGKTSPYTQSLQFQYGRMLKAP